MNRLEAMQIVRDVAKAFSGGSDNTKLQEAIQLVDLTIAEAQTLSMNPIKGMLDALAEEGVIPIKLITLGAVLDDINDGLPDQDIKEDLDLEAFKIAVSDAISSWDDDVQKVYDDIFTEVRDQLA